MGPGGGGGGLRGRGLGGFGGGGRRGEARVEAEVKGRKGGGRLVSYLRSTSSQVKPTRGHPYTAWSDDSGQKYVPVWNKSA